MQVIESQSSFSAEPKEQDNSLKPLLYLLSSKKGWGHITRAAAIAQRLPTITPICFGIYGHAQNFIEDNLKRTNISFVSCNYDVSQTDIDFSNHDAEKIRFLQSNPGLPDLVASTRIILTDFLAPSIFIRDLIEEMPQSDHLIVGIYHSFDGYNPLEANVREWQAKTAHIVDSFDLAFLIEPKLAHSAPYFTNKGTLIIPCGPVVRDVTKNAEVVKRELGFGPDDDFVVIQAGMRGSKELTQFLDPMISPLQGLGLKIVLMHGDMEVTQEFVGRYPSIVILPSTHEGQNIMAAASGVIAKPGMQTLSECLAYRTPLLFVNDNHPERKLKIQMLKEVTNDQTIPIVLSNDDNSPEQVVQWFRNRQKIISAYTKIDCNGADVIAQTISQLQEEGRKGTLEEDHDLPVVGKDPPPGKKSGRLSIEDSVIKIAGIREHIHKNLIASIKKAKLAASIFAFGGIGKGILRPDSDADILVVVKNQDLDSIPAVLSSLTLKEEVTAERIQSLKSGSLDSLRLKSIILGICDLNISLMTEESYRKIFSPLTTYFREELGSQISGNPYYIPDFQGKSYEVPKIHRRENADTTISERRSPGIIEIDGKKLLGVKERMLLTSEIWQDELSLGDPASKILRGVARAICYWNKLYKTDAQGNIYGVKPQAFDQNYFFRILRDPMDMYSPSKIRSLKNLYFNELRRINFLARNRDNK